MPKQLEPASSKPAPNPACTHAAGITVRGATAEDADAIAAVYNPYITHTTVTFEEEPVTAETIRQRMADVAEQALPWLIAESGGDVVGYAYASRLGERAAYRYSVETAVYVDASCARGGVGSALYRELLPALSAAGKHAAVAKLSLPNDASVGLHERFGFEKVGHLAEVGRKFGRWLDVGYWQLTLTQTDDSPDSRNPQDQTTRDVNERERS